MDERFIRTKMLLGVDAMEKLRDLKVIVFGVGGVGGYVCEALARSGVGNMTIVDKDVVSLSNINRQIIALSDTIGRFKTDVMKERMELINPSINVEAKNCFFLPENAAEFDFTGYDYVVDAVDTVTAKIKIIECAKQAKVNVISSMGAGNKLDPTRFRVSDISQTSVCPLAKVMRRELKKRGIENVKAVWSDEPAVSFNDNEESIVTEEGKENTGVKRAPGSISFVPSVVGLIIAGEVIKDSI